MAWTSRARHFATVAAGRGRRRLIRTRLVRRVVRPDISVIVPFYNVEKYFESCLESIRAGGVSNIEVLLVDDGSPDGSRAIAEQWVRRDKRFRIVTRANGGLGAARNTGVREARGRWLTFVDSDDQLAPGALAELLNQARATGAQIVVGSVQRFNASKQWSPTWVRDVHKRKQTGIQVEEFLPLLRNLYTWNKLFRRDFWDEQDLWFREGVAYEDQPIITELFVAAKSMDVIPAVVYRYRARDDGSSISQQTGTMKDLRDRVAAWRATEKALRESSETVRRAWLQTLFDAHFNWYLMSTGTVDDDYWALLQEVVTELVDSAPQELWDRAPARNRVLLELTRQDRRADVQEFVRLRTLYQLALFDSELTSAGIDLKLPFRDDPDLADDLFLVRPVQMTLAHRLDRLHRVGDHVELAGYGYVEKVDLATRSQRVEVVLQDQKSGEQLSFEASTGPDTDDPDNPPPVGDDWSDYRPGHFVARIPVEAFEGGPWHLALRVTVGDHVVEDLVTNVLRRGPLGLPPVLALRDGVRLAMNWRVAHPVQLVRSTGGVEIDDVDLSGRTLSGRLRHQNDGAQVEAAVGSFVVRAPVTADGRFSLELPSPPQLRGSGAKQSVEWKVRCGAAEVNAGGVARTARWNNGSVLAVGPDRRLALTVTERRQGVEFDAVDVVEEHLVLNGSVAGPVERIRITLVGPGAPAAPQEAAVRDHRFETRVALSHEVHRFGKLPLPTGVHRVVVEALVEGAWTPVESTNAPELVEALPLRPEMGRLRGTIGRGAQDALELALIRPTGRGATRQTQQALIRRAESSRGVADRRGILFRAYFGEKATDNGVAIQAELARRGSDLPVYWAVQDHSTPVPDGGIRVVVNTPEWFEVLSSVRYYVDNMYQPEYHLKPEGQVLVQTFHGYPFKQMGLPHWHKQQFAESLIESYHQRSEEWDYLVSPARYATPFLTRDFGYDGPVLEIGYPRNDVLQSPEAEQIREQTRASLGIRADQQVVLYAPTFRDYLAKNNNQAAFSDFLDFDLMHRSLGDDVVVLMRGHAFNARTGRRIGSSGNTIDVTDYPEVSDLYLAADVCVADYSSLRFDFGVTGKPMIFLVPDLQRYVDTRGWLFDFEPTAPGPKVDTTEEVVHHLRNIDALVTEHAAVYEKFRSDFLDLEDGRAAARFVDAVIVPRGDA